VTVSREHRTFFGAGYILRHRSDQGWYKARRDCGNSVQNVKHIVQERPMTKFQGTWDGMFTASPEAIAWIES